TSAGAAAGFDLCPHLVRRDLGAEAAAASYQSFRHAFGAIGRAGPVHRSRTANERRNNKIHIYEPLASENAALVLVDHQAGLITAGFSETKRQVGLLRMLQAGVIVSDYATLMVEILKDNARPEAGEVYGAMDMPWAKLVGQIAQAYGK